MVPHLLPQEAYTDEAATTETSSWAIAPPSTLRKMHQHLGWAVGYNALALPIAAGVFVPSLGLELRPEIAALSMSGSSFIVAVNALTLKRARLPEV